MATILITGSNRGIGLAMARAYHAQGDKVIGTQRSSSATSPIDGMEVITMDAADEASCSAAGQALRGRPIDLLIVNAGANNQARGGLSDPSNTAASWASMLAVNVTGVFMTVRAFVDSVAMAKGKVAVISSQMGSSTRSGPGSYGYRASKAAASNLVVNLALELAPRDVAIASYHPGWVKTDMGGAAAALTPEESTRHLMAGFDRLSLATSGGFFDYDGKVMPF